jgi:hypothetical protein
LPVRFVFRPQAVYPSGFGVIINIYIPNTKNTFFDGSFGQKANITAKNALFTFFWWFYRQNRPLKVQKITRCNPDHQRVWLRNS